MLRDTQYLGGEIQAFRSRLKTQRESPTTPCLAAYSFRAKPDELSVCLLNCPLDVLDALGTAADPRKMGKRKNICLPINYWSIMLTAPKCQL